jgi:threonine dehydratase
MDPEKRANGVIAYSSGNHAQGVALAARMHGVPSVIVMPSDAPALKIENTKALGAQVVLYDRDTEDRDEIGARIAADRGLILVKPFDDPLVIAGQGTAGLEIAEDANALGLKNIDVLVCCGGGGFTSGIALACEADAPTLRVRPVEPDGFDDVARSLISGKIERNTATSGNICDAIITPQAGDMTFPIMHRLCGPGLVIRENEALMAMAQAFLRLKLVAEPGGAAALAAALYRPDDIRGDAVIVTISGGNVDPAQFAQALATLD